MLKLIIALLVSAFVCYELNHLISCFMVDEAGIRERLFYIAVAFAMYVITFYFEMDDVTVIICYGVGLCLMEYRMKTELSAKLTCFVYSFCLLAVVQIMAATIMYYDNSELQDNVLLRQVVICSMQYFMILILWRRNRVRAEIRVPVVDWILLLLAPPFSLHFISLLFQSQNISVINKFIGAAGVILIDYAIVELYQALARSYQMLLNQRIYEEQSRYYKKQLQYITESYQTVRSVKHDIKNVLNSIKNMVHEEKYQEIVAYVDQINDSTGFNTSYVETGNSEIDGILNYQIQRARSFHIQVDCKTHIPEKLPVDEIDMSILLGNILDNAIEASRKIAEEENRKIKVDIHMMKDNLFIHVTNPYEGIIQRDQKGSIRTSKENKKEHGIGLQNVQKVVDKYHGEIKLEPEHQVFSAEVILYIP